MGAHDSKLILINNASVQMSRCSSIYFAMTGMHALHMIIGICIMLIILFWSVKGKRALSITTRWRSPGFTGTLISSDLLTRCCTCWDGTWKHLGYYERAHRFVFI